MKIWLSLLLVVACSSGRVSRDDATTARSATRPDPSAPGTANAVTGSAVDTECAGRSGADCVELGRSYWRGSPTHPQDRARALRIHSAACARKVGEACTLLGVLVGDGVTDGVELPKDEARGRELYELGCSHGDGEGCWLLGLALGDSEPARALALFERGCRIQHVSSCEAVGSRAPDPQVRATALLAACTSPFETSACKDLVRLHVRGDLSETPAQITARLEELCTTQSVAAACEAMGHRAGRDDVRWYVAACTLGDLTTCRNLGRRFVLEASEHADPDAHYRRAILLLQKACDGGEDDSCEWLARARHPPKPSSRRRR